MEYRGMARLEDVKNIFEYSIVFHTKVVYYITILLIAYNTNIETA